MKRGLLAVVALWIAETSLAQEARQCTGDEEREWRTIWRTSLGVDAVDPLRYSIQTIRGESVRWPAGTDGLHEWIPFGPRKAKLCGALREHRPFCPNRLFDVLSECDQNAFLLPAPGYEYLRDEPIANGLVTDRDKMVCCETASECSGEDKVRCIEAELTPSSEITEDEAVYHYFESLLGPKTTIEVDPTGTKPWLWKEMCTYGPWVGDAGHGARPEIHPVQLRWTREAEERALVLMLMQDASGRFLAPRNFVHRRRPGDDWSPWAVAPVHGLFKIAFQSDPGGVDPPTIRVLRELGNHIHPSEPDGCRETAEGCVLETKVDGNVVLRVLELLPPEQIRVTVEPPCRRADGLLIGYVQIQAAVGHERCDDEGYLVLRVEELRSASETPALAYRGEPLFAEVAASGSEELEPPGLRMEGGVTRVEPIDLRRAEGVEAEVAWKALLDKAASGVLARSLERLRAPPVGIVRARRWGLSVEPHYAGTSESGVDINEAIAERKKGEIVDVVPSAGKFHVDVPGAAVTARDLARPARPVAVQSAATHEREAPPSRGSMQVERWNTSSWSPGVRLRIPDEPPDAVYEVVLETILKDEDDNGFTVGYAFLSHGVDGKSHRELVRTLLAQFSETEHVTGDDLVALARDLDDPWEDNRGVASRASQLLVVAEHFGRDGIITDRELVGLVEQVHRFRDAFSASRPGAR